MLEIANLEVVYHSVVLVLRGVSLHVPQGEIVALLGPNGAGKTTTLRAITGLLGVHDGRVTKGTVTLDGQPVLGRTPDAVVRKGVAQVMEGRRVFTDLTVEENLLAGAATVSSGVAKTELDRAFSRFPILKERSRQAAGYLSGGEQQMLAIARALMSRPRLLLLDEPSLGLAPRVVRDVAAIIREINEDGVSILLVEQNAAVALELSGHGYVLESGKVVLDDTAEALQQDADVREFYLGLGGGGQRSYRDVKLYRRRKRWLS